MDSNNKSSEQVISELVEMGFEHSKILKAIKVVGLSIPSIVEHIFNTNTSTSKSSDCEPSTSNGNALKKRTFSSSFQVPKPRTINHYFQSTDKGNARKKNDIVVVVDDDDDDDDDDVEEGKEPLPLMGIDIDCGVPRDLDVASDWEQRASVLLQKHFGFSSLKSFQKEALSAWIAHKDCLVLAATGSGKSLCFQIPALLTGKVVVVISPLISLMHDQCLKLTKHGISACFLGSGQPDNTVEKKAMRGMYNIVYVCPETVLRLIQPLQKLAESRGIALFAIDEVHCVSKWGHDFRPAYSRLSALRENFTIGKLKSLKFDIPIMALTATATKRVQEDILKSLRMSKDTNVVLTSFFRPNLRFTVKNSRTSWASYEKDFHELIKVYGGNNKNGGNKKAFTSNDADDVSVCSDSGEMSDTDSISSYDVDGDEDDCDDKDSNAMHSRNTSNHKKRRKLTVEFLENDVDVFQSADDLDVACGEFCVQPPPKQCQLSETIDPPTKPEKRLKMLKEPFGQGPTIIYVPTRKETVRIAKYLCKSGVKAAAYNAGLPKLHLRRTHKEFHENTLEVVVATIAFGMGIDKSNVRRIIHYGWPQSLEAYYQEAGRAGRDGKLADCILYANLARKPSLLPSRRSEEMTKQAYIMLSDCFRYGMNISCCRAKTLVEYFGEDFSHQKCLLCDVCTNGPPQRKNLKEEACILLQTIGSHNARNYSMDSSYIDDIHFDSEDRRLGERPSLMTLVRNIREQFQKFVTTDILWWRGLSRILEAKGFIREGDNKTNVQIKYPELTKLGLEFMKSETEEAFYVYPEADMLLETKTDKPFSSFSEWGKGWADPEIRRQRLERMQHDRSPTKRQSPGKRRKRKGRKAKPDLRTSRGRLTAKLSKLK